MSGSTDLRRTWAAVAASALALTACGGGGGGGSTPPLAAATVPVAPSPGITSPAVPGAASAAPAPSAAAAVAPSSAPTAPGSGYDVSTVLALPATSGSATLSLPVAGGVSATLMLPIAAATAGASVGVEVTDAPPFDAPALAALRRTASLRAAVYLRFVFSSTVRLAAAPQLTVALPGRPSGPYQLALYDPVAAGWSSDGSTSQLVTASATFPVALTTFAAGLPYYLALAVASGTTAPATPAPPPATARPGVIATPSPAGTAVATASPGTPAPAPSTTTAPTNATTSAPTNAPASAPASAPATVPASAPPTSAPTPPASASVTATATPAPSPATTAPATASPTTPPTAAPTATATATATAAPAASGSPAATTGAFGIAISVPTPSPIQCAPLPLSVRAGAQYAFTCSERGYGGPFTVWVGAPSVARVVPNTEVRTAFKVVGIAPGTTTLSLSAIGGGTGTYAITVTP